MKFLLAFAAAVYAQDKTVGTPCTFQKDECGDAATMCCGIATGGKMCTDETCGTLVDGSSAPNAIYCNKVTSPSLFNTKQAGAATTEVHF